MTVAFRTWLVPAIVALAVGAIGLQTHGSTGAQAASTDLCTDTAKLPLSLTATMPKNFVFFAGEDQNLGQARADCQAWQQFIYMNWPALPSPQFGIPNPQAPFGTTNVVRTVWVSYNRAVDIFVPNAPTKLTARPKKKVVLSFVSEPLGNTVQFSGSGQAFTDGWIVGQKQVKSTDGKLTYSPLAFYDVWVDRDEQDYTWSNQLQYAVSQNTCAVSKYGFNLPKGQNDADCYGHSPVHYGLGIGAVEVKAALLDLGPAPLLKNGNLDMAKASQQFPTYFLFPDPVELDYPAGDMAAGNQPIGAQPNRLVGLVGLHIIRKVPGAQQFLWTTFEHRDNDPAAGQTPPPGGWTFNSPSSRQTPNVNPASCPSTGCNYGPSQIVRTTPLDSKAQGANASFYALPGLPKNSVFRHYELVQVQWPQQDFAVPPAAQAGLVTSFFVPASKVANSTLETFLQGSTCVGCHSGAPVATTTTSSAPLNAMGAPRANGQGGGHVFRVPGKITGPPVKLLRAHVGEGPPTPIPEPTGTPYASDYSFLYGDHGLSGTPPPTAAPKHRTK